MPGHFHIMRDDNDGLSFPVQEIQNVHDRGTVFRIKIARRFVRQDDFGIVDQ